MKKTPENVAKAQRLLKEGMSQRQIAREIGVSKGAIRLWFDDSPESRKRRNRVRQDLRNHKYKTNPLYRIKQRLRVAAVKARKLGYLPCSTSAEEILELFTGICQICDRLESECGSLCIDHWHDHPGEFRAWICSRCNRALGFLGDDPEILRRALKLLTRRN
jgi:transcriptional regulator with XRE-family HTH domain